MRDRRNPETELNQRLHRFCVIQAHRHVWHKAMPLEVLIDLLFEVRSLPVQQERMLRQTLERHTPPWCEPSGVTQNRPLRVT